MKIGILGGGLAGLSVRYFLKPETELLEKETECGGLCRSFNENGFVFDQGGHILFSKNEEILRLFKRILGDNVGRQKRNNRIYYDGRLIKYPFENGLSGLSKQDNFECLYYYLKNDSPNPQNFKEWLYFTFGKGITEKYLIPYNQKLWKFNLGQTGLEWVARVPRPPLEDVIKSSLGIETEGYLHQLFFLYPKSGGIQSLIRSLETAKKDSITTGFLVNRIRKTGNKWIVSDGNKDKKVDKLVSTIPIFDLLRSLDAIPDTVLSALSRLKYNSMLIVMLGLNQDNISDSTAIYFPQEDTLYHRICFMNNFSRNNAPAGKSSLVAEITCKEGDKIWNTNDNTLADTVVTRLNKAGIIDKRKVIFDKVHRVKYAYVIYGLDYNKNLSVIKEFCKSIGIYLLGRFAEFEYLNMDEVAAKALKMAEKLNTVSQNLH